MQHIKRFRSGRRPTSGRSRRVGADAVFAKAMARSEFGRFYTDEQEQREVRRSLARAKANRPIFQPERSEGDVKAPVTPAGETRREPWKEPNPRHRRTELAEAKARLKAAAKLRSESTET